MIITCPACATQFRVDGTKISPSGTKVRCARCSHVWLQTPDQALPYPGETAKPKPPPPAPKPQPAPQMPAPEPVIEAKPEVWKAEPPPRPEPPPPHMEPPPPARPSGPPPEPFLTRAPQPAERPFPVPPPRAVRPPPPPIPEESEPRRGLGIGLIISFAMAMLVAGGAIYALLHYHTAISNRLPFMARFYDAIDLHTEASELSFQNVSYNRTYQDGTPVLEIRGEVVNTSGYGVEVPRIRAALRDKDGKELYKWTFAPPKSRLSAKETSGFASRLPSPPTEAVSLAVSFAIGGAN